MKIFLDTSSLIKLYHNEIGIKGGTFSTKKKSGKLSSELLITMKTNA